MSNRAFIIGIAIAVAITGYILPAIYLAIWPLPAKGQLCCETDKLLQVEPKYPVSKPELRPLIEQRYCGEPQRDADGSIHRSRAVLYAFQKIHPCPANSADKGACPGWAIDHVIPLACGGCDAVSNLQWLPLDLKAGKRGKDRFERLIYCTPRKQVVR